jgi:acyl-CoA synthetase (AMP-forming)/AMP-acid ligase II
VTTFSGPPLETEPGLGALTMSGLLRETVARHADREALVFHGPGGVTRWTYADLDEQARRTAGALLAAGVVKGTRVGLLMGNRPEWVASAFGVALAGGVLVPFNTYFEPPELAYVLGHADVSVLLLQHHLLGHEYAAQVRGLCPELPSTACPFLRRVVCLGEDDAGDRSGPFEGWDDFLAVGDAITAELLDACTDAVDPSDDAVIIYTSGTTARPKGALHAHRAAAIQAWRFAQQLCLDPSVRTWSAFPFFWTAGYVMIMGGTLAAGGTLVLQEHFEPGEALRLIETERVTSPHAWPHQLAQLEDHPDWPTRDLSSLRQVESFSSFGRHKTVQVEDVWSPRAAYGLTETCTIVTSFPCDTPREMREGNSGPVLPGNHLRIVDPETGEHLDVGETGQIAAKGPTLMKGYVKVAPDECFDVDGFFHTGDAGYFDDTGLLHWTGRTSDLIKTGGANVSPVEIETALLYEPRLKAAVAVGVPDDLMGELVVVCAVRHEGADVTEADVQSFLRGRLASYKIPRRVLFVSEADLTFTGSAKVRTDALRALARERLSSSAAG